MNTGTSLILVSILATARAEIIKPWKEWLCNYCAMGESREWEVSRPLLLLCCAGASEDSEECGTPILCTFYGLLLLIILFTIYTTIKGTRE